MIFKIFRTIGVFLVISLLCSFNLLAQNSIEPTINWSKKEHMVRMQDFMRENTFLNGNADEFISLYRTVPLGSFGGDGHTYFVKVNLKSGEREYHKLELKEDGKKRKWRHVLGFNDEIYIISSFQNKKDKKHYIFLETLNQEKLELNNDARLLGEISYEGVKGDELGNFVVTKSPEKKRILITYSILQGKDVTSHGMQVLDSNFKVLSTHLNDIPRIEGKDVYFGNYAIDDAGNVYLSQSTFDKKIKKWNSFLSCVPMSGAEPKVQELKLSDEEHSIASTFIFNSTGEVMCVGLYSDVNRYSAQGTFSTLFTPGLGAQLNFVKNEFDDTFITHGMLEKDAKKMLEKRAKGDEFDEDFSYYIDTKYYKKDGNYSIVIEKYKLQTQTVRSNGGSRVVYYYNYNDIMLLTYDKVGTVKWMKKVPKQQRLVDHQMFYGSYKAFLNDDSSINILYNEGVRDKISEQSQPLMLTFTAEGKMSIVELFKEDKEVRKSFVPMLSYRFPDNKYLFGLYSRAMLKGDRMQWGVTTLDLK